MFMTKIKALDDKDKSLSCSTVPREGFDSSVIMPFSWGVVAVTLIV